MPGPESVRDVLTGRMVRVSVETWPEGDREVVHHPGSAAIVAFDPSGSVVLVGQLRRPLRERVLEIPAGVLDEEGETPADTAARELREETGYRADRVEHLATVLASPGYTDERVHVFTAEAVGEGEPDEHDVDVVTMPFDQAVDAALDGTLSDAKTVVGILLAARRRRSAD